MIEVNAIRTIDAEALRTHLGRSLSLSLLLHLLFGLSFWLAYPVFQQVLGGRDSSSPAKPRMQVLEFRFNEILADVSAESAVEEAPETPIQGAFNSLARDRIQDDRNTPVPAGGEIAFDNSIPGTGAETDVPGGVDGESEALRAATHPSHDLLARRPVDEPGLVDALPLDAAALLTGRRSEPVRPGHGARRDASWGEEGALEFGDYSFSTLAWDYEPWSHHWRNKVENAWRPPAAFLQYGIIKRGWTVVHLVVGRDGKLKSARIVDSDGHESLHRSSLAAIEGSAPYRPLPADFPDEQLEITARFTYWSTTKRSKRQVP